MADEAGARFATRGHPAALAIIRRAIRDQRPPHALLLSGPAGVGKSTLADDLASGLLCTAGDVGARPCRTCAACRRVANGNHPDLHLLAPEGAGGQIRLGQVQALTAELALLPLEGSFRIAIVRQAQRLNLDAQHAILKTLEEPPARVVLVLAADEPAGLLPTVVSRCARLRLGPVSTSVVAELLAERGLADAARGAALGRLSGGRPGVAIVLAANPELLVVHDRLARTLLDLLEAPHHVRLAAAAELLADGAALARGPGLDTPPGADEAGDGRRRRGTSGSSAAAKVTPAERRAAVAQVIATWRAVARDLALAARGGLAAVQQTELLDELAGAGTRVSSTAVAAFIDRLEALGRALDGYANPELVLDALLLEWPSSGGPAAASAA